jgi:hypothetical protein
MIAYDQEVYILNRAYVPEHIVSLMVLISGAEPFLIGDCLCFLKDNWLILIGYPLEKAFSSDHLEDLIRETTARFKPQSIWIAAPDIPDRFVKTSKDVERDLYYRIDLDGFKPGARLMREVGKVAGLLTVERSGHFTKEHGSMVDEFIERERPSAQVEQLYRSLAEYTSKSHTAALLDGRDKLGRLAAFYVVEFAAKDFAAYVVGCHSKQNYVSHSSDLLFHEMVRMAGESGKSYINLGLGVNDGIRRFKEKWGGRPYLKYVFCDYQAVPGNLARSFASMINAMKAL